MADRPARGVAVRSSQINRRHWLPDAIRPPGFCWESLTHVTRAGWAISRQAAGTGRLGDGGGGRAIGWLSIRMISKSPAGNVCARRAGEQFRHHVPLPVDRRDNGEAQSHFSHGGMTGNAFAGKLCLKAVYPASKELPAPSFRQKDR